MVTYSSTAAVPATAAGRCTCAFRPKVPRRRPRRAPRFAVVVGATALDQLLDEGVPRAAVPALAVEERPPPAARRRVMPLPRPVAAAHIAKNSATDADSFVDFLPHVRAKFIQYPYLLLAFPHSAHPCVVEIATVHHRVPFMSEGQSNGAILTLFVSPYCDTIQ